jgi:hypothetical protein
MFVSSGQLSLSGIPRGFARGYSSSQKSSYFGSGYTASIIEKTNTENNIPIMNMITILRTSAIKEQVHIQSL